MTDLSPPVNPDWHAAAILALQEDRAFEDVTTRLLDRVGGLPATGTFRAEETFTVAGFPLVEAVFHGLDPSSAVSPAVAEGAVVSEGAAVGVVRAAAGHLLSGERVALNYLQRLSGIATATRRAADAVAGTRAVVTDTRKTTPGLRDLEKYAVRVGGGVTHRRDLADAVLWKDNHWALLSAAGETLDDALARLPEGVTVQVEVETETQLEIALAAKVRFLLVDNQPPEVVATWVRQAGPDVIVEASGGITPETARGYALAGVHRISMGCITHSVPAVSISFEIVLDQGALRGSEASSGGAGHEP